MSRASMDTERRVARPRARVAEATCEEMRRLYAVTEEVYPGVIIRRNNVRVLCQRFDISYGEVHDIIERKGRYTPDAPEPAPRPTRFGPQSEAVRKIPWETVWVAWRAGKSFESLGQQYGVSGKTIRKYLDAFKEEQEGKSQ